MHNHTTNSHPYHTTHHKAPGLAAATWSKLHHVVEYAAMYNIEAQVFLAALFTASSRGIPTHSRTFTIHAGRAHTYRRLLFQQTRVRTATRKKDRAKLSQTHRGGRRRVFVPVLGHYLPVSLSFSLGPRQFKLFSRLGRHSWEGSRQLLGGKEASKTSTCTTRLAQTHSNSLNLERAKSDYQLAACYLAYGSVHFKYADTQTNRILY